MSKPEKVAWLTFLLSRVALLFISFPFSDIAVWQNHIEMAIAADSSPYIPKQGYPPFPYPSLALIPVGLAYKVGSAQFFPYLFRFFIAAVEVICLWLLFSKNRANGRSFHLWGFVITSIILSPLALNRYDSTLGLIIGLAAFYLCMEETVLKKWRSAFTMAAATSWKLMPVFLGPYLLVKAVLEKRFPEFLKWGIGFGLATVGISIVALLPFTGVSELPTIANMFTYHSGRPLQIESLAGNLLCFATVVSGQSIAVIEGIWGDVLANPIYLKIQTVLHPALIIATSIAAAFFRMGVTRAFFVVLLTFIVTCKVLSPQYLFWIFPLFAMITWNGSRSMKWANAGLVIATGLTTFEFLNYSELVQLNPFFTTVVLVRNLLLVSLLIFAFVDHFSSASTGKP
jgi:hypothetical protein